MASFREELEHALAAAKRDCANAKAQFHMLEGAVQTAEQILALWDRKANEAAEASNAEASRPQADYAAGPSDVLELDEEDFRRQLKEGGFSTDEQPGSIF